MSNVADISFRLENAFKETCPIVTKARIKKLWGNYPELPSVTNPDFLSVREGFTSRELYREQYGFILMTEEFIQELDTVLRSKKIKNFVELGAGTGFFALNLNNIIPGIGYTLELNSNNKQWCMRKGPIYNKAIKDSILHIGDIRQIKHKQSYDMIVSTWVPLGGGQEHIEFMANNKISEWYLTINEAEGGCTGSEEYWRWVEKTFEPVHRFETYRTFSMLWDEAILWRKLTMYRRLKRYLGRVLTRLNTKNSFKNKRI